MAANKMENPFENCPARGELFKKVAQRFPDVDLLAMETLTTLQSVYRSVSLSLNGPLVTSGLSEGKFYILLSLFQEDILGNEDPSPSFIADRIGVTRGTITGLLDGLERDGYVKRTHQTTDRRGITVSMTEKCREFLEESGPSQTRLVKRMMSPLTPDEQETLIRLLAKIEPETLPPGKK